GLTQQLVEQLALEAESLGADRARLAQCGAPRPVDGLAALPQRLVADRDPGLLERQPLAVLQRDDRRRLPGMQPVVERRDRAADDVVGGPFLQLAVAARRLPGLGHGAIDEIREDA